MVKVVPSQFKKIKNEALKFEDGKIYVRNDNFLFGLFFVFALLAVNTLVIIWLYQCVLKINHYSKNDPIGFIIGVFMVFELFFLDKLIGFYNCIDFTNGLVYKEFFFFGMRYKYSVYRKEEIVHIGNTVVGEATNPGGKTGTINGRRVLLNPETNLFDSFRVNILINNGYVFSSEIGHFREDYNDSITFASLLADHWNIPLIVCPRNHELKVYYSGNGCYSFIPSKIGYCSWLEKITKIIISIIIIMAIMFGAVKLLQMYDSKKRSVPKYKYEYRYNR